LTTLLPSQGAPSADGKNWVRPPIYYNSGTVTTTQPGTDVRWQTGTNGSYNASEAANILSTENEAGQHWVNSVRQWVGTDANVDGVNLGQFTGVLFAFEPLDEPSTNGFRYGLEYSNLTDKGAPASAGPYQRLLGLAGQTDPRTAQSVPGVPLN